MYHLVNGIAVQLNWNFWYPSSCRVHKCIHIRREEGWYMVVCIFWFHELKMNQWGSDWSIDVSIHWQFPITCHSSLLDPNICFLLEPVWVCMCRLDIADHSSNSSLKIFSRLDLQTTKIQAALIEWNIYETLYKYTSVALFSSVLLWKEDDLLPPHGSRTDCSDILFENFVGYISFYSASLLGKNIPSNSIKFHHI